MFCEYCGKQLSDDAIFCPNCGSSTSKAQLVENNQEQPQGNGMAVAGFVCSFFVSLLGWIFGGIGLSRAGKRNGKGKGFSVAALVIASVTFIINLAIL